MSRRRGGFWLAVSDSQSHVSTGLFRWLCHARQRVCDIKVTIREFSFFVALNLA